MHLIRQPRGLRWMAGATTFVRRLPGMLFHPFRRPWILHGVRTSISSRQLQRFDRSGIAPDGRCLFRPAPSRSLRGIRRRRGLSSEWRGRRRGTRTRDFREARNPDQRQPAGDPRGHPRGRPSGRTAGRSPRPSPHRRRHLSRPGRRRPARASRRHSSTSAWRRAPSSTPPICSNRKKTRTWTSTRRCRDARAGRRRRDRWPRSAGATAASAKSVSPGHPRHRRAPEEGADSSGPGHQGADQHQGLPGHRADLARRAVSSSTCRTPRKVGVSRKIESREQRAKLREMVTGLLPKDSGGMIVRTVAEGVTEEHFRREVESLLGTWKKINRKKTFVRRAPALLQRETSLTRGIIRDLFSAKVDALWVDSTELYHEIEQYLEAGRSRADGPGAPLRRARAALRQVRHRVGDPRPLQAARRAADRRATSSSSRPRRWCRST